jgi:hypothetical protein
MIARVGGLVLAGLLAATSSECDTTPRSTPPPVVVHDKKIQTIAGTHRYRVCVAPEGQACEWKTITGGRGSSKRNRYDRCQVGERWPACKESTR